MKYYDSINCSRLLINICNSNVSGDMTETLQFAHCITRCAAMTQNTLTVQIMPHYTWDIIMAQERMANIKADPSGLLPNILSQVCCIKYHEKR